MSRQDRQHYVPQSLLKNFALDTSKRQAYVIKIDLVRLRIENKQSINFAKEICPESIKKLCSELNYLSTNFKNFDKEFEIVDRQTPPVIKKILSSNSSNKVCKLDKKILSEFAAYQYVRGRAARQVAEKVFSEHFNYTAIKKYLEPFNASIPLLRDATEHIKELQASLISKADKLTSFFNDLMLDIIIKEEDDAEFIIGDSPTLYDATGYGIYVPINPTKCL